MTTKIKGTEGVEFPDASVQATAADAGPAFSAYANAAIPCPSGVVTLLPLQAKQFDTANGYSTVTGRFTPNVAGYYQLNASISLNSVDPIKTFAGTVHKNGVTIIAGSSAQGGVDVVAVSVAAGLVYLNGTTDFVTLNVYQATGAPFDALGDSPARTTFSGCLVRKA